MIDKPEAPLYEAYLQGLEVYDSREAYEKKHGPGSLPPFDPTRDRRRFTYPAAAQFARPRISFVGVALDDAEFPYLDETGAVALETFTLSREEAAAPPNIPSREDVWKGGYTRALPYPLRKLEGDEYLALPAIVGKSQSVVVRRRALWEAEQAKDPQSKMLAMLGEILALLKEKP